MCAHTIHWPGERQLKLLCEVPPGGEARHLTGRQEVEGQIHKSRWCMDYCIPVIKLGIEGVHDCSLGIHEVWCHNSWWAALTPAPVVFWAAEILVHCLLLEWVVCMYLKLCKLSYHNVSPLLDVVNLSPGRVGWNHCAVRRETSDTKIRQQTARGMNWYVTYVWISSSCTLGIQDSTLASYPGRVDLGMRLLVCLLICVLVHAWEKGPL